MALIYEKKDGIAYVTINRPEARNALDPETLVELHDAWMDFRDDPAMRAAILTGAGNDSFCAGADLKKLIPLATGVLQPANDLEKRLRQDPTITQKAFLRTLDIYKPMIAAIRGHCLAGGLEMALACDIRIAADDVNFGIPEAKWGIFPLMGSTVRLTRQIPFCNAMEMFLTAEPISAQEAWRLGLINRVVPRAEVMPLAVSFAEKIRENAPLSLQAIKKSVLTTSGRPLDQARDMELAIGMPIFATEDAREGPKAFKEKRQPQFKGK